MALAIEARPVATLIGPEIEASRSHSRRQIRMEKHGNVGGIGIDRPDGHASLHADP